MKTSNIAIALVLSGAGTASASDPAVRELLSRIETLSSAVDALTSKITSLEETESKSPEVPQSLRRLHGSRVSAPLSGGATVNALEKCLDKRGDDYEEDCATAATALSEAGIVGGGRATMCYSDEVTDLMVRVDGVDADGLSQPGPGKGPELLEMEDFEGYFDFATLSVGEMQTVIVDVEASTGNLFFTGNDNDFEATLADSVGNHTAPSGFSSNWNSVTDAKIFLSIELMTSGGVPVCAVPERSVPLMSKQDVFALDQDDWHADDDAFFFQKNETSVSTGKFLFPNLSSGDYNVKVLVNIEGAAELHTEEDDADFSVVTKVTLGPHSIVATVVDGEDSVCNDITEVRRRD